MTRSIGARRVFEITLKTVSLVFALQLLFTVMYFLCVSSNVSDSFRSTIYSLQSGIGITNAIVAAFLVVFAFVLACKDRIFPVTGFLVSVLELVASILFVSLTSVTNAVVFNGVSIII